MKGNFVDIPNRRIFPAELLIQNGTISSIKEISEAPDQFILPGFIDAHVHIESSMLLPTAFAEIALTHGTVATISDPHEIGNVLGIKGVEHMIENGRRAPLKFYFGAPSCVPATNFETAGAVIDSSDIEYLLSKPEMVYLAEMMNYPGVLFHDKEVLKKLEIAKRLGKPIDGHAPGLRGEDARNYFAAGITTDHECFTYDEALEKLELGVKILIREGSAAKNYNALAPLIKKHAANLMFCSDDKHPDDLLEGHINQLVVRAIKEEYDLFDVLQMACINPVQHYKLDVGTLNVGDPADLIVVKDLTHFKVLKTMINGELVAEEGRSFFQHRKPKDLPNNFNCSPITIDQLKVFFNTAGLFGAKEAGRGMRVIQALDGELITKEIHQEPILLEDEISIDTKEDILKLVVVNRYNTAPPAIAFIKGFGFKRGAIASSVAHDCHNIVAVGTSDSALVTAINLIIEQQGGISVAEEDSGSVLPLPVAGIMSPEPADVVGATYAKLDQQAKSLGSTLKAPFMTLSFMALLVIPDLKLSDKGLFSGSKFEFVDLEV